MDLEETTYWVQLARGGDLTAFTNIVDGCQKPVFHLCFRMLGNSEEAEDAAQETFMRAYRSLYQYDDNRTFMTWLLSIASHYCIDQLRREKKENMYVTSASRADEADEWDIPDTTPGPEAVLKAKEDQMLVRSLLEKLEPIDRAVIVLMYWNDYSYEQIAEVLSLTVSAVKSRLHRARRGLAKAWMALHQEVASKSILKPERKHYELPVF
jgi:RNA polymerase sigma-70 factor (ECF subfamily)